jgi:hypothetical protein
MQSSLTGMISTCIGASHIARDKGRVFPDDSFNINMDQCDIRGINDG